MVLLTSIIIYSGPHKQSIMIYSGPHKQSVVPATKGVRDCERGGRSLSRDEETRRDPKNRFRALRPKMEQVVRVPKCTNPLHTSFRP